MEIIIFIQLSALLFCCVSASYMDLKQGKISNQLIAAMLVVAAVLDIFAYGFFDRASLIVFLKNSAFVCFISGLLYFTHIWAGGDTKLLIAIALLYPSRYYWMIRSLAFPLLPIIAPMFIIGFVYLLVESLTLLFYKGINESFESLLHKFTAGVVQYLKTVVFISALCHIYLFFIAPYLQLPTAIFTFICIIFVWIFCTTFVYRSKLLIVSVLVFDILMTVFTGNITVSTFGFTYVIAIVFLLLRVLIGSFNYETIPTDQVREGMVLSHASSIIMQNSKVSGLPGISDETLKSRLSADEAKSIQKWEHAKSGCSHITIVKKIPFAIFISLGTLAYFVIGMVLH